MQTLPAGIPRTFKQPVSIELARQPALDKLGDNYVFHKMKFCSEEGRWPRCQVYFSFSLYLGHLMPRHIPSHPLAHVSLFPEMTLFSRHSLVTIMMKIQISFISRILSGTLFGLLHNLFEKKFVKHNDLVICFSFLAQIIKLAGRKDWSSLF